MDGGATEGPSLVIDVELHRSTYYPSPRNAAVIKNAEQNLYSCINDINAKIARLEAQRDAVQSKVDMHRAIRSPIRRLPTELLADIIVLSVPENYWTYIRSGRRSRSLSVMRVCHSWRTMAIKTPRLWSTINIDSEENYPPTYRAAIQVELDRTAQEPLHLDIKLAGPDVVESECSESCAYPEWTKDPLWHKLCAQSHRWATVRLSRLPDDAFDALDSRTFPLLKTVSLVLNPSKSSWTRVHMPPPQSPFTVFSYAPNLRRVYVDYVETPSPIVPHQSWTFTELNINANDHLGPDLAPFLPLILASRRTLRKCCLQTTSIHQLRAEEQPVTTFPVLQELALYDAAVTVCHLISVPNMTTATLRYGSGMRLQESRLEVFNAMVQRSSGCPALRTFSVVDMDESLEKVVDCFRGLPTLTDVTIANSWRERYAMDEYGYPPLVSLGLVQALTRGEADPPSIRLLPRLARLTLRFGHASEQTSDKAMRLAIRKMVMSRVRATSSSSSSNELGLPQQTYLEKFFIDGPHSDALAYPARPAKPKHYGYGMRLLGGSSETAT